MPNIFGRDYSISTGNSRDCTNFFINISLYISLAKCFLHVSKYLIMTGSLGTVTWYVDLATWVQAENSHRGIMRGPTPQSCPWMFTCILWAHMHPNKYTMMGIMRAVVVVFDLSDGRFPPLTSMLMWGLIYVLFGFCFSSFMSFVNKTNHVPIKFLTLQTEFLRHPWNLSAHPPKGWASITSKLTCFTYPSFWTLPWQHKWQTSQIENLCHEENC